MNVSNTDELPGFVSSKYREGERGRRRKQDIPDSDLRSETLMIIIKNMYLFRRTYSESFSRSCFLLKEGKRGGVCAKQRICRDVDVVGMSSSVCTPTFFRGFCFCGHVLTNYTYVSPTKGSVYVVLSSC